MKLQINKQAAESYIGDTSNISGARRVVNKFWVDRTQPPDPEKFTGHLAVTAYNLAKKAWDDYQKFINIHKKGTTRGLEGTAAAADKTRKDEIFVPNFKFQFSDKNTVKFKGNINDTKYGTWKELERVNGKRISVQEYINKFPRQFMSPADFENTFKPRQIIYKGDGKTYTIPNTDDRYWKYVILSGPNKGLFDRKKTNDFKPNQKEKVEQPIMINLKGGGVTILYPGSDGYESAKENPQNYTESRFGGRLTIKAQQPNTATVNAVPGLHTPVVPLTGKTDDNQTKTSVNDPLVPNGMPAPWARKWAGGTGESLKSVNKKTEAYLTSKGWNFDGFGQSDKDDLMADFRTGRAVVFDRADGQYLHYNDQVIFNPNKPSNSELSQTVAYNQNKVENSIQKSNDLVNSVKPFDEDAP